MKIIDLILSPFGARDANCPTEASVLAYSENKLSSGNRVRVERHFFGCEDCRELLAILGSETKELTAPLSQAEITEQTSKVLGYIRSDEMNRTRSGQKARAAGGFHVSYPRLATAGLTICALLAAAVSLFTGGQSSADAGMEAFRLAVQDQRPTVARISGVLGYSKHTGETRGGDSSADSVQLDRAENAIHAAAQDPAEVEARLVWARVLLARRNSDDVKRALVILEQLINSGVEKPEAFNDAGVAQLQSDEYEAAISYFNKALAKSPAYNEALFNKALAEQFFRHDDDARRDWQQFIDRAPDDDWKTEAKDRLSKLATSNR